MAAVRWQCVRGVRPAVDAVAADRSGHAELTALAGNAVPVSAAGKLAWTGGGALPGVLTGVVMLILGITELRGGGSGRS